MGYEDSVYLAKLAEQAERYEGQQPITYFKSVFACNMLSIP